MFVCTSGKVQNEKSIDIGTLFINWNKVTIASLRLQSAGEKQERVRDYYKNRLAAFHAYIDIKTDSQLNKSSIRYEFLNKIKGQLKKKDIFIIEAPTSGERVEIRNFVLYPRGINKADVEVYHYNLQGWEKGKVTKDYQQTIDTTLLNHRVKWPNGFNHDDIIISHFQKGQVSASGFFLFGTLSNEIIKRIVSIW